MSSDPKSKFQIPKAEAARTHRDPKNSVFDRARRVGRLSIAKRSHGVCPHSSREDTSPSTSSRSNEHPSPGEMRTDPLCPREQVQPDDIMPDPLRPHAPCRPSENASALLRNQTLDRFGGHPGDSKRLARGGVAGFDRHLLDADSQSLGDQLADRRIGRAALRGGGDADFQGAVQFPHDSIPRGLGNHLHREENVASFCSELNHEGIIRPNAVICPLSVVRRQRSAGVPLPCRQ